MTMRYFNQLSETAKHEEVELWGDLLLEKIASGHLILFYRVHDFFVEVYTDPLHRRIQKYRACLHNLYRSSISSEQ